jgi:O-antigen ligase
VVFSGKFFFSDLHLAKWVFALAPLALLGFVGGYRTLRNGPVATSFHIDGFACVWLFLIIYTALQPLWTDVRSVETLLREWFFFAGLWLAYVLTYRLMDAKTLRAVLWGSVLSAAVSVGFAELQRRGVAGAYPFIYSSSGDYIANTGQQNMLALWLAIGGLNGVFLFFSADRWKVPLRGVLLLLLSAVLYGLITSASRSGILAFALGSITLGLFLLRSAARKQLPKILAVMLIVFFLAAGAGVYTGAGGRFLQKMGDMLEGVRSIGDGKAWMIFQDTDRSSVYATSWTMFAEQPWKGVGLGQFKWNYLQAQREAQRRWPYLPWGYTYWAHNEILQWFAETGIIGGLLMLSLWLWWAGATLRALITKPPLTPNAFWGSSMATLFLFNAMWTRPFHRIENAVWLALAFAMANREMLRPIFPVAWSEKTRVLLRPLGGIICLMSLLGLFYLGDGVRGDRTIRRALLTQNPLERGALLERARNSLMVRDVADKQLAYFHIAFGELQNDPDMIARGINSMIDVFTKQPHVYELQVLRKWAKKLNHEDLNRYVSFFTDIPDDLAETAGGGK